MKIAILETGRPPERLVAAYPGYAAMVADLVGDAHAYTVFDVAAGDLPTDAAAFDAYLITGSAAGAYEPLPWIAALIGFLRRLPPTTALVGICFGHQVMAAAFGGRVAKSARGWGLGLHSYDVHERRPWMDDATHVAVPAIHQDQVVEAPPGSRTLAGSGFTPHGILAYGDRRALSFQFHPEFSADYATALIAGHAPTPPLDETLRMSALASMQAPGDGPRIGGWIRRFLAEMD